MSRSQANGRRGGVGHSEPTHRAPALERPRRHSATPVAPPQVAVRDWPEQMLAEIANVLALLYESRDRDCDDDLVARRFVDALLRHRIYRADVRRALGYAQRCVGGYREPVRVAACRLALAADQDARDLASCLQWNITHGRSL